MPDVNPITDCGEPLSIAGWLAGLICLVSLVMIGLGVSLVSRQTMLGGALMGLGCLLLLMLFGRYRLGDRRSSADRLAERERLDRLLDATQDGMWELDTRTRQAFCSDQCLALTGADSQRQILPRGFLRKLKFEQRRRLLQAFREALNESGRFDELVSVTVDGGDKKRWLRIRARVSADRRFITGVLSDVSDEVELTRERGLNQSFIEGVLDSLPLPVSVKNAEGCFVLVNKKYCDQLGMHLWEIIGKNTKQISPGDFAEQLEALDRLTIETGRVHSLEDWVDISRIKQRIFLRVTKSRCVDRNGHYVVVTTYEDQSKLRDYANRMANLSMNVEAFVQRLIRSIPYPIYVKNAESRYVMGNPAVAEQWGLRVEDMIGMSSAELFGNDIGGAMTDEDLRIFAGEVVRKEDCIPDRHTGKPRYWAVSKAMCTDVDGNRIIIGANFEITPLRELELELREALQQQTRMRLFLQQVFDALPHPLFVKDRSHRFMMTNRAHLQFHGCDVQQMIGSTSFDYLDHATAEVVTREEEALLESADAAVSCEREFTVNDAQGEAHQFLVRRVACDGMDGERVVIGVVFDVTSMRKLESDLREAVVWQTRNRTFLRDLFDAIPSPVTVKDEQHRCVMVNRASAKVHGLTPDQMIGKTSLDLNLPEVASETIRADNQLFAIGPGVVSERRVPLRFADGKIHQVRLQKSVCVGTDGAYLLITSLNDVTELVEKEAALVASLERQTKTGEFLQTVFDTLPFATCIKDEMLQLVQVNAAMAGFFGLPREDFCGRQLSAFLPPDLDALIRGLDQQLIERDDGEVLGLEFSLCDRRGRTHQFITYEKLVRNPDGRRVIIALNQDVTDLREIEQAQQMTLERLDTLVTNAPMGITLLDRGGRFLRVNPALLSLLGRPEEQLHQMRFKDVVPECYWGLEEQCIRDILSHGVILPQNCGLFDAQGRQIPVLVSGVRVGADDQDGACWLLVQDLTLQKMAEDDLRLHRDQLRDLVLGQTSDLIKAKEAAEHSSAVKSAFIAQLSHELRTPLHAILSFARLGAERGNAMSLDKIHDYFVRVVNSGEQLISLLDELLDLAKLESGKVRLAPTMVDLPRLLDSVAQEFEALFVAQRLELSRIDTPDLPKVSMDVVRITQVLRNLLSNAAKFAPEGSRVTLRTGLVSRMATAQPGDLMVEIAVIDEGPGVPEAELERIFDRFAQSSLTHSAKGGTGLGLAICREIVRAHDGDICARNRHEGGAEFIVCLPIDCAGTKGNED
jgi:PAS domain S-box-containing protein